MRVIVYGPGLQAHVAWMWSVAPTGSEPKSPGAVRLAGFTEGFCLEDG